ncbi:hypothetical protein ACWDKQ_28715 [Saccharopolyspora sp. NPDC000995]
MLHERDRLGPGHPFPQRGVLGEVGWYLDLAAMVTELADGSALAQRAGRVNRRGLR